MCRLSPIILIAYSALGQTDAQIAPTNPPTNPPTTPSSEVAEIKVNISGPGESRGDISNGRLQIRNVPLRYLIAEAWTLTQNQVKGPSWLDEVRIDILAKAASPQTSDADVRKMIQTLLRERMKLTVHTEEREEPVWALSVWKGQPKLTPSEMPARPEDSSCTMNGDGARVHFTCTHLTMALLAHKLPPAVMSINRLSIRLVSMAHGKSLSIGHYRREWKPMEAFSPPARHNRDSS